MTVALDLDQLPDDPKFLQKLVIDLLASLESREELIAKLKTQLSNFQRHRFGKRSEALQEGQLVFDFLKDLVEKLDSEEAKKAKAEEEAKKRKKPPRPGHGRRPLAEELPRDDVPVHVPAGTTCGECGTELVVIRSEVAEKLVYVPSSFRVRRTLRDVAACPDCEGTIVTAPLPPQLIDKGLADSSVLAHVAVSKFADHLPLNRLEGIFRRQGVDIARSTMCGWLGSAADLLEPFYDGLVAGVLRSRKIHTDETKCPVLDRSRSSVRHGSFWIFHGDDDHPYDVYEFAPSKTADTVWNRLKNYSGYLQADASPSYDRLYKSGRIVEVACLAHARRKFFEAQVCDRERSLIALVFIRALYRVEQRAAGKSEREVKALRDAEARPMVKLFQQWLETEQTQVLPKSKIGEAIEYAVKHWLALTRYLESGILSIDNNVAERALRKPVVGRKNYLFAGSDEGGRRAAIFYTLVESARRNGLDPFAYLKDLLDQVSTLPASRIAELFPDRWKPPDTG